MPVFTAKTQGQGQSCLLILPLKAFLSGFWDLQSPWLCLFVDFSDCFYHPISVGRGRGRLNWKTRPLGIILLGGLCTSLRPRAGSWVRQELDQTNSLSRGQNTPDQGPRTSVNCWCGLTLTSQRHGGGWWRLISWNRPALHRGFLAKDSRACLGCRLLTKTPDLSFISGYGPLGTLLDNRGCWELQKHCLLEQKETTRHRLRWLSVPVWWNGESMRKIDWLLPKAIYFYFFSPAALRFLVPWLEIEPVLPALEGLGSKSWTAKEFLPKLSISKWSTVF